MDGDGALAPRTRRHDTGVTFSIKDGVNSVTETTDNTSTHQDKYAPCRAVKHNKGMRTTPQYHAIILELYTHTRFRDTAAAADSGYCGKWFSLLATGPVRKSPLLARGSTFPRRVQKRAG